jgi:hypothetical protein
LALEILNKEYGNSNITRFCDGDVRDKYKGQDMKLTREDISEYIQVKPTRDLYETNIDGQVKYVFKSKNKYTPNNINIFAFIDNIKKTFNQNVFQNQLENINRSELSNFKPVFVISFPGLGVQELVKDLLKDNATAYLGENSFLSQMLTGSRYSNDFLNLITKFTQLDSENLDIFRLHYLGSVAKVV